MANLKNESSHEKSMFQYITAIRSRIDLIDNFTSDLPANVLKQEALFKFWRCVIGACVSHQYYGNRYRILDECSHETAVDIGILFGCAFALLDNAFDNPRLVPVRDRHFFWSTVDTAFKSGDGIGIWRCASHIKPIILSVMDKALFNRSKNYIELFIACQFRPSVNSRLQDEEPIDSHVLLRDTAKQASAARIAWASLFGVNITEDLTRQSLLVGLHNQLTNDIEGWLEDQGSARTIFNTEFLNQRSIEFVHTISENLSRSQRSRGDYVNRLLYIRLLEVFKNVSSKLSQKEFVAQYATWSESVRIGEAQGEAEIIKTAAERLGLLHQEYVGLGPFVKVSRDNRRKKQNNKPSGQRVFEAFVDRWCFKFEAALAKTAKSREMEYALHAPASRLRSYLTLLLTEELGRDPQDALNLACAIEIFHTASLIIDDLPAQDNAGIRRGRRSLHLEFSEAAAQLACFEMMSIGYGLLGVSSTSPSVSQQITKRCVFLTVGPSGMIAGQKRDLQASESLLYSRSGASVFRYLKANSLKTGIPFRFALEAALILSGKNDIMKQGGRIGLHLGLLYQIGDDILDSDLTYDIKEWYVANLVLVIHQKTAKCIDSFEVSHRFKNVLTWINDSLKERALSKSAS